MFDFWYFTGPCAWLKPCMFIYVNKLYQHRIKNNLSLPFSLSGPRSQVSFFNNNSRQLSRFAAFAAFRQLLRLMRASWGFSFVHDSGAFGSSSINRQQSYSYSIYSYKKTISLCALLLRVPYTKEALVINQITYFTCALFLKHAVVAAPSRLSFESTFWVWKPENSCYKTKQTAKGKKKKNARSLAPNMKS